MNPITHLLASWWLGEASSLASRDRNLITWAGVLPDLDGAGAIVDAALRALGRPQASFYLAWHHHLLHGLPGAVLIAGLVTVFSRRRMATFLWSLLAVHVHLLCDLVGSRGPAAGDLWPIGYLQPFSSQLTLVWSHQWPLDGWPNLAITMLLLALVLTRAIRAGHSPVSLVSSRANGAFAVAVQARWRRITG